MDVDERGNTEVDGPNKPEVYGPKKPEVDEPTKKAAKPVKHPPPITNSSEHPIDRQLTCRPTLQKARQGLIRNSTLEGMPSDLLSMISGHLSAESRAALAATSRTMTSKLSGGGRGKKKPAYDGKPSGVEKKSSRGPGRGV